jgi:hypothetical protein
MTHNHSDTGPDKEELQRLLQAALRKQRPRRLRSALGVLLLIVGVLALLAWLFYPPPAPPQLLVVAFDDIAPAGKEVTLLGRLEAPLDEHAKLGGRALVFVDGDSLPIGGRDAKVVHATTNARGEVSCRWTFPPDRAQGQIILRQIGETYSPGMEDRSQIFLIKADTPLCLVQFEETLTPANDQTWLGANPNDVVPKEGAAAALTQLRDKGYAIVYLALGANHGGPYQKMRDWLHRQGSEGASPLPDGAVLSRFALAGQDADKKPWQKAAQTLAGRFVVPKAADARGHIAIAGTIDVAQQFHAAGLRTYYLGAGEDLPAGVNRVKGWEDIAP